MIILIPYLQSDFLKLKLYITFNTELYVNNYNFHINANFDGKYTEYIWINFYLHIVILCPEHRAGTDKSVI